MQNFDKVCYLKQYNGSGLLLQDPTKNPDQTDKKLI